MVRDVNRKRVLVHLPSSHCLRTIVEKLTKRVPGEYVSCRHRYTSNSGILEVMFVIGSCTDCLMGVRYDVAIVGRDVTEAMISRLYYGTGCDIRIVPHAHHVVDIIGDIHDNIQDSIHIKVAKMQRDKLLGTLGRVMEYLGIDIEKLEGDNGSLYDTIVGQIETIKDGGLR